MNVEKQTLSLAKTGLIPTEYFHQQRVYREQEMWIKLLSTLVEGEWYSIKIERRNEINYEQYIPEYGAIEHFYTDVYVGKIKPLYTEWKPSPKLSFIQRLKVLFTGEYPQEIVRK